MPARASFIPLHLPCPLVPPVLPPSADEEGCAHRHARPLSSALRSISCRRFVCPRTDRRDGAAGQTGTERSSYGRTCTRHRTVLLVSYCCRTDGVFNSPFLSMSAATLLGPYLVFLSTIVCLSIFFSQIQLFGYQNSQKFKGH